MITALLDEILLHLIRLKRPVVDLLQPGLSRELIKESMIGLPFELPQEVYELYEWRNGSRIWVGKKLGLIDFAIPGFYFCPWDEVIENYHLFKKHAQWNKFWLPIFGNGGGDFYAVDCEHWLENKCPVVGFMLGEPEQHIEYLNLMAMFQTILECYKIGAFFVNQKGYLETAWEKRRPIGRKYNPGLKCWLDP